MGNRVSRYVTVLSILSTSLLLMLSYQNFSVPNIPLRKLLPQRAVRTYKDANAVEAGVALTQVPMDIRESAPTRPRAYEELDRRRYASLQAPPQATSAEGAGTQWAERELRPYLSEYEGQFVAGVNHRLNRLLKFEELNTEWPASTGDADSDARDGGSGRGPASDSENPSLPPAPNPADFQDLFSLKSYRPTRVQMTKANELTVGFRGETALSCEVNGAGSKVKLARPLDPRTQLNVSHDTVEKKNSVNLSFSW